MVRPHLVYANLVWNPRRKQDIEKLEILQMRTTVMIRRLTNLKQVWELLVILSECFIVMLNIN